jgi:hypothetical protein
LVLLSVWRYSPYRSIASNADGQRYNGKFICEYVLTRYAGICVHWNGGNHLLPSFLDLGIRLSLSLFLSFSLFLSLSSSSGADIAPEDTLIPAMFNFLDRPRLFVARRCLIFSRNMSKFIKFLRCFGLHLNLEMVRGCVAIQ